jgi:predicted permease
VTNPYSSEQFPPRRNLPLESRRRRRTRAIVIRFGWLAILLTVGIVLLVLHHYTIGVLLVAWAVIRSAMITLRIQRWRRRAAGRGGSWGQ